MNLATKAPNFTPENAAEMARRATKSRVERIAREKHAILMAQVALREARPKSEDARSEETLRQIDRLDKLINHALDVGDEERFLKLAGVKEKLWKLVQPTAGVARPKRNREPVQPVQPLD